MSRPRSSSPNKNSLSDDSVSPAVRSHSPGRGKSRDNPNPIQSIVDTAQQTGTELAYQKVQNHLPAEILQFFTYYL